MASYANRQVSVSLTYPQWCEIRGILADRAAWHRRRNERAGATEHYLAAAACKADELDELRGVIGTALFECRRDVAIARTEDAR